MEGNKLSIIMPVYNVAEFVEKAVQSVLQQTYRNIELVMVDDGSTDGSREICQQLAESDSRVKLICKKNEGVSIARNVGLDMATGDYITFADSDDWVEADAYEKQMSYIQETKADICVMGFTPEGRNGFVNPLIKKDTQVMDSSLGVYNLIYGRLYTWSLWDKIYKSKVIGNLRFADDIANGEDLLFNWKVFRGADKVAYLPLHGYHYLQRKESITNTFSEKKLTVIKAFDEVLNECDKNMSLYEIVNEKYIVTMISLMLDYFKNEKDIVVRYKFVELKKSRKTLRKQCYKIFCSNIDTRTKIAAIILMLPVVFTVLLLAIYFAIKKLDLNSHIRFRWCTF